MHFLIDFFFSSDMRPNDCGKKKRKLLFSVDEMPDDYKEIGILHGYRNPQSSAGGCLKSMFEFNNETVNVWTHFLPAL